MPCASSCRLWLTFPWIGSDLSIKLIADLPDYIASLNHRSSQLQQRPAKLTTHTRLARGNAPNGLGARFPFECIAHSRGAYFSNFGSLGSHRVPWLRVGSPNFVLWFVETRIIQSSSRDALSEIGLASKQSRTAFRTKTAHIVAHHFAGCAEIFRRALGNLERVRRDIKNRSVPSAGCFLAIPAV